MCHKAGVEQTAILKRWIAQTGDHGSDIGQSDRDYGAKREMMCLGMYVSGSGVNGHGEDADMRRCPGLWEGETHWNACFYGSGGGGCLCLGVGES
jgi:hypothetical protein